MRIILDRDKDEFAFVKLTNGKSHLDKNILVAPLKMSNNPALDTSMLISNDRDRIRVYKDTRIKNIIVIVGDAVVEREKWKLEYDSADLS